MITRPSFSTTSVQIYAVLHERQQTKETKTATGATLEVEGLSEDKAKATATVELIREGNAWKIGKESWKQGP